jgi:hypothetical protein
MDMKSKMTTVEGYAAEIVTCFINKSLGPIAKYVVDNYSNISESTEDELINEFRKLVDVKAPTPGAVGIMGMAPDINKTKEPVKRTRVTTKEDKSVWSSVEDFVAKTKEGEKLCSYYSNRATGENKNKVCCNPAVNVTSEYLVDWRCATHKDKKSSIDKVINSKDTGLSIDKNNIIPNLNVPKVPLPGMPPPLLSMGHINGSTGIPPVPPNILGVKTGSPKLPPPPLPMAPVSSPVKIPPKIPSPPKEPVVEEVKPESLELTRMVGLDAKHLIAKNEALNGFVFEYNPASGDTGIYVIGKFNTTFADNTAPATYMSNIENLSADEQKVLTRFPHVTSYKPIVTAPATLPGLPALPTFS